ncbi:hypothetical protein EXS71_01835 [Candidatus Uhrbacteria bacterium]|nr:hypothetical protein [Candidatus Uhrbacteria bacterium]
MTEERTSLFEDESDVLAEEEPLNNKFAIASRMIQDLKYRLEQLERLLMSQAETVDENLFIELRHEGGMMRASSAQDRMLEGVFNGEHMVGEDGQIYHVPANYASKSKLVEGDLLKLTIVDGGRFLFKQKGPMERERCVGTLVYDEQLQTWKVVANGLKYRVLPASVSFYHGQAGDEVAILVPKSTPSRWAAIEHLIKQELGMEN